MNWLSWVDWGDAPSWVAAGATVAALLWARQAVRKSGALLTVEQERDRKRDEADEERRRADARAEQADLVAAWLVRDPSRPGASLADPNPVTVNVENGSRLPVYDVQLEFFGPPGFARAPLGTLPPGSAVVEPPQEVRREDGVTTDELSLTLSFRDTAGRTWRRDGHGQLHQTGVVVFGRAAFEASATLTAGGVVGDAPMEDHSEREPQAEN
jgi:hypothetical protein